MSGEKDDFATYLMWKYFGDMIIRSMIKRIEYYINNKDRIRVYVWARNNIEPKIHIYHYPERLGTINCPVCGEKSEGYVFKDCRENNWHIVALHVFRHPQNNLRNRYHWVVKR